MHQRSRGSSGSATGNCLIRQEVPGGLLSALIRLPDEILGLSLVDKPGILSPWALF
ncbi:hypothetical protein OH77DRAFT_1174144 [Trametes cingulata]|nr:hypothetical protein OH77DRAFT_1174144 [Trametes cingulata]